MDEETIQENVETQDETECGTLSCMSVSALNMSESSCSKMFCSCDLCRRRDECFSKAYHAQHLHEQRSCFHNVRVGF